MRHFQPFGRKFRNCVSIMKSNRPKFEFHCKRSLTPDMFITNSKLARNAESNDAKHDPITTMLKTPYLVVALHYGNSISEFTVERLKIPHRSRRIKLLPCRDETLPKGHRRHEIAVEVPTGTSPDGDGCTCMRTCTSENCANLWRLTSQELCQRDIDVVK